MSKVQLRPNAFDLIVNSAPIYSYPTAVRDPHCCTHLWQTYSLHVSHCGLTTSYRDPSVCPAPVMTKPLHCLTQTKPWEEAQEMVEKMTNGDLYAFVDWDTHSNSAVRCPGLHSQQSGCPCLHQTATSRATPLSHPLEARPPPDGLEKPHCCQINRPSQRA